jgi:NADH:quinone reductase (non-electrogenic)
MRMRAADQLQSTSAARYGSDGAVKLHATFPPVVQGPETRGKTAARPDVVIIGAGFGGLAAAQELEGVAVNVTVVDQRNFHLFQPLLYQVATAGLNPSDIAWPIRGILSRQTNAHVRLGEVCGVDTQSGAVLLTDGQRLSYDWLILATGATQNYFGNERWAPVAPGLKRIDDATLIRRRILLAFERAEVTKSTVERRALMTFVIIGAGPTGVELAGAIAELAKKALAADFRTIDPRDACIVLIEGGNRVLPTFPASLSDFAQRELARMGVDVWCGTRVESCDSAGVIASGKRLEAATVLWAAGVAASPAAVWLGVPADRAGRVLVQPDLTVPGHDNIFVIGDTAMAVQDGAPVPGIAPAAKQGGRYAARVIRAAVARCARPAPFRYRHFGSLATIGRNSAVIDFGPIRLRGTVAWFLWGAAHVYFLISMRHRVIVTLQWLYSYVTFGRGARLIVGSDDTSAKRVS